VAEADLGEIWAYLAAETSEAVATRFVKSIEAAFEPLRSFPLAAPPRQQFAPRLRVTFHGAYAIYYRPDPDAVVIIRVLHGARDAAALAARGGFAG
jgi:toxin ParE1/3/4